MYVCLFFDTLKRGAVNFIQACPPALSEFQSHRSGKLSAAGYFESVGPGCILIASCLIRFILLPYVLYPHIIDGCGWQIRASMGIYISMGGRSCGGRLSKSGIVEVWSWAGLGLR